MQYSVNFISLHCYNTLTLVWDIVWAKIRSEVAMGYHHIIGHIPKTRLTS